MRRRALGWILFLVLAAAAAIVLHNFMTKRAVFSHRAMMGDRFADQLIEYDQEGVSKGYDFIQANERRLPDVLEAIAAGVEIEYAGEMHKIGFFGPLTQSQMDSLMDLLMIKDGRLVRSLPEG